MTVEAVDLGIGPVRYVKPFRPGGDRDSVSGTELAGAGSPAAEGQIIPGDAKRARTENPGRQHVVEVGISGGDVEQVVHVFHVGRHEVSATLEVVVGNRISQ